MMVLVMGGSGSGKSDYAENTADLLSKKYNDLKSFGFKDAKNPENMKKYYLATMQVFDEEGRRKAARHRKLRSGKGFVTIEQPAEIQQTLYKMEAGGRTVLLECLSNLAANEMFSGEKPKSEAHVVEKILKGVEKLKEETTHLVVVSNNVFEDGITYEETTMEYIRAMGKLNQRLAVLSDRVVEVVAGIPVIIKQR